MTSEAASSFPTYEADEKPAPHVALGLGVQSALLAITPIALFPLLFAQSAESSADFTAWAVFAMLVVNGLATVLQAYRLGPLGAGMFVAPYPWPTAIPFCILAVQEGGTGTLAALILATGAFQILVAMRMALLRRLVTPAISGAILILLIVTLVPVVFRNLDVVPDDSPAAAGPMCILVTFAVIVGLLVRGSATWRVWASVIGIAAGSVVAVFYGIYDFEPFREAPVVGLPLGGWPGLNFTLGAPFWSLLPVFLFLSTVGVLQGNSVALATQRLSWRAPRAMDYRRVQGVAVGTGLANVMAGFTAVMPITTSPRGVAFAQQTGCASRYVGVITGALLVAAAFFPKTWSLLIGIPAPVIAIYIITLMGPLVVEGMKLIIQDAPDYRTSLVIGIAISVGLGLQSGLVSLPVGDLWNAVLQKGLTGGGALLVLLTVLAEFRRQRRRRIQVDLSIEELPKVSALMQQFSSSRGWSAEMTARLQAVAEETMLVLQESRQADDGGGPRRLVVEIGGSGAVAELEFVSAGGGENLEDRVALLSQTPMEEGGLEAAVERDASLRLMRHYAASVSHRQYFDAEIISLRVTPPKA